ncbi:MAG: hypothetical protein ACOC3U_02900 [Thiohalospira sp.]
MPFQVHGRTAVRIELDAMDRLYQPFNCSVGELFEFVPDSDGQ